MIIISIIILANIASQFCIEYFPVSDQWFVYVLTCLINTSVLAGIVSKQVSYKTPLKKIVSFMIFYGSLASLVSFCLLTFAEHELPSSHILPLTIYISTAIIFIISISNTIKFYKRTSDPYQRHKSYLVYKPPKHLLGLLAYFVTAPNGHCYLVTNGRRFSYRNGKLLESDFCTHRYPPDITQVIYREIPFVSLSEARELVGRKWTIFSNCFSTFKRFKNEQGRIKDFSKQ